MRCSSFIGRCRYPSKFSAALREIPHEADAVRRDLNPSVWNGSVRLSLGSGSNGTFAKCAGYLMFAGEPIVVADIARLLGTTNIETPRLVVTIRAPGQTHPRGLLVESQGDIPEVL